MNKREATRGGRIQEKRRRARGKRGQVHKQTQTNAHTPETHGYPLTLAASAVFIWLTTSCLRRSTDVPGAKPCRRSIVSMKLSMLLTVYCPGGKRDSCVGLTCISEIEITLLPGGLLLLTIELSSTTFICNAWCAAMEMRGRHGVAAAAAADAADDDDPVGVPMALSLRRITPAAAAVPPP